MQIKTAWIVGMVTLWVSIQGCASKDTHIKAPPIVRDTFQNILYDLHYADAMYQPLTLNKDSLWHLTWSQYKSILDKHHITYAQFKETYNYYCYHAKELDDMYQHMVDNVSIQQAQLEKK